MAVALVGKCLVLPCHWMVASNGCSFAGEVLCHWVLAPVNDPNSECKVNNPRTLLKQGFFIAFIHAGNTHQQPTSQPEAVENLQVVPQQLLTKERKSTRRKSLIPHASWCP